MNRLTPPALSFLLASAALLSMSGSAAYGFDVNRNGCSFTATNGKGSVITAILADDFGGGERGEPRTTIDIAFPDTAPLTEGLPKVPGIFAITLEPEGQRGSGEYPWREGWPVTGTFLQLRNIPIAVVDDIGWFIFVTTSPQGAEETIYLTYRTDPVYAHDDVVTLSGNGWEIPSAVDMLNRIETAASFELQAIDDHGRVLAAAAFDSSEGAHMIEMFGAHYAETKDMYDQAVEEAHGFDCDAEAPL